MAYGVESRRVVKQYDDFFLSLIYRQEKIIMRIIAVQHCGFSYMQTAIYRADCEERGRNEFDPHQHAQLFW